MTRRAVDRSADAAASANQQTRRTCVRIEIDRLFNEYRATLGRILRPEGDVSEPKKTDED